MDLQKWLENFLQIIIFTEITSLSLSIVLVSSIFNSIIFIHLNHLVSRDTKYHNDIIYTCMYLYKW